MGFLAIFHEDLSQGGEGMGGLQSGWWRVSGGGRWWCC